MKLPDVVLFVIVIAVVIVAVVIAVVIAAMAVGIVVVRKVVSFGGIARCILMEFKMVATHRRFD